MCAAVRKSAIHTPCEACVSREEGEFDMAEDFTDEELETGLSDPRFREVVREAQKTRKELNTLRAEKARNSLNVLFDEARIPTTGAGLLFRDKYAGAATVDAVRAEAEKYGIVIPPPANDPAVDDELARLKAIADGTSSIGSNEPDDRAELMAKLAKAVDNAEVESLMAAYEAKHPNG